MKRNWNSRFDKTLLVQISGQWPDADKLKNWRRKICAFLLLLPSCYCHGDYCRQLCRQACSSNHQSDYYLDVSHSILFVNSSQFAATSFKSIFLDALASLVLVMIVGEQVFSWDILNRILVQHDIQTKRSIDIFTLGGNNYAR